MCSTRFLTQSSQSGTSNAWGRSSSRRSHPASPTAPSRDLSFSPWSPPDYSSLISRPHSRNTHHRGGVGVFGSGGSFDHGYSSPEDTNHTVKSRPISRYGYKNFEGLSLMTCLLYPRPVRQKVTLTRRASLTPTWCMTVLQPVPRFHGDP